MREWLEEQIDELEAELEPPPPSYAPYELQRQRNIVSNHRLLVALAQAALRDAPAGASSSRLALWRVTAVRQRRACKNRAAHLW